MKIYCKLFFIVILLLSCQVKTQEADNALTVLLDTNNGWVRNFSPFSSTAPQFVKGFMNEYLTIFDSLNQNKEYPWLAEEVISEKDKKTLTIKLREGIFWNDGEAFNADDVVFSFEIGQRFPELDYTGDWGEYGKLESVRKIDNRTVEVVAKKPNRFHRLDLLIQRIIVAEHYWSKIEEPASHIMLEPIVTGPFSEVKIFTPEMIVLGRNPTYWRADELYVDELRIPQFNGNDSALNLLRTGSIDWAYIFIPDIEKNYIQGDPSRRYWYGKNDAIRLSFNYMSEDEGNLEAFKDPNFKRVISLASDRQGIINSAVYGYLDSIVPPASGLPETLWSYRSEEADAEVAKYTTFDLAKAKALLLDSGYFDNDGDGYVETPTGKPIDFQIVSPAGWSDWNSGADIIAQDLQTIGINAEAKPTDLQIMIEKMWTGGDWNVFYNVFGLSPNIWKFYFDTLGDTSRVKTPTWWSTTQMNYVNPEISKLISLLPTASDEELKEITNKIEVFVSKEMLNVPLFYNGLWHVYNTSRFTGWSTEENPTVQPALPTHDSKVLQLMRLRPVQ